MKNKRYNEENELLETTYLKDSVAEFMDDPKDEKVFDILTHLVFLAGTGAKALMPLLNLTRLALDFNPDTEAEDLFEDGPEPEELFSFVESEDGRRWFPLYTDREELDGVEKTNAVRAVTVRSIIEAALESEAIDGIMINPNSDSFALSKVVFEKLLEKADMLEGMGEAGVVIRPERSEKKNNKKI